MTDAELQAIVAEFREAAKEDHPEGRRCVSATIAARAANALLAEVERLKTALLAEREACAAICDKVQTDADYRHSQNADPSEGSDGAAVTAKLIRERGKP